MIAPTSHDRTDTTRWGYKLHDGGSSYGLDVLATQGGLSVNEKRMSVVIPFADGHRRDGVGDLLEVGGIDTSRHITNPLFLFDHGKTVTLPVAQCQDPDTSQYTVILNPVAKVATAEPFFYQGKGLPGVDRQREYDHALFCQQLFDLIRQRFIRAGSIGYQVIKAMDLAPDYEKGLPKGLHLLKTLMLECSAVVLPCNQDTVSKMLALPKVCGKPLSPWLIKSLTPYAPPRKAQLGYDKKAFDPHQFRAMLHEAGTTEGQARGAHQIAADYLQEHRPHVGSGYQQLATQYPEYASIYGDPQEPHIEHDHPITTYYDQTHDAIVGSSGQTTDELHRRSGEILTRWQHDQSNAHELPEADQINAIWNGARRVNRELAQRGGWYQGVQQPSQQAGKAVDLKTLRQKWRTPVPHGDLSKTDIPPARWKPGAGAIKGQKALGGFDPGTLRAMLEQISHEYVGGMDFPDVAHVAADYAEELGLGAGYEQLASKYPHEFRAFFVGDTIRTGESGSPRGDTPTRGLRLPPDSHPVTQYYHRTVDNLMQAAGVKPTTGQASKENPHTHQGAHGLSQFLAHRAMRAVGDRQGFRSPEASRALRQRYAVRPKPVGPNLPPALTKSPSDPGPTTQTGGGQKIMSTNATRTKALPPRAAVVPPGTNGAPPNPAAGAMSPTSGPPPDAAPPDPAAGAPDAQPGAPPTDQGAMGAPTQEKYSAQAVRKLHRDALVLLQDYAEIEQMNEHPEIGAHIRGKLQSLVQELDQMEALFAQHHGDLPPLEGAGELPPMPPMDENAQTPPPGAEGAEDGAPPGPEGEVEGEMDTMDDEGVPAPGAPSPEDKEPTAEEAVEGMDKVKEEKEAKKKAKGDDGPPGKKGVKALRLRWRGKATCPDCKKIYCTCNGSKSHKPPEEEDNASLQDPDGEDAFDLDDRDRNTVQGATGFLEKLGEHQGDWPDDHLRFNAFHFHKLLSDLSGEDGGDSGGDTKAAPTVGPSGAPGTPVNPSSASAAITGLARAISGKTMHPHRKACHEAGAYLKRMVDAQDFGEDQRSLAKMHATALKDLVSVSEDAEGGKEETAASAHVGEMDQKAVPDGLEVALRKSLLEQAESTEALAKALAGLTEIVA